MSTSGPATLLMTRATALPAMIYVDGGSQRHMLLDHTPFTIGRRADRNLVLTDPRVSREHAEIVSRGGAFQIVDSGSTHGTYVNGERIEKRVLAVGDRITFGVANGAHLLFMPEGEKPHAAREFLSQISDLNVAGGASDLEKLSLFLQAARKLNTTGAVAEVLVTLLESTLKLTKAERGFVFLKDEAGELTLAAGRTAQGAPLVDDKTISHSVLRDAVESSSEFVITDSLNSQGVFDRKSIVANELRTIICIPLRRRAGGQAEEHVADAIGVLYLDSRIVSREITQVSKEILSAIATEAAALVENARLAQAEEAARQYQQELALAASIQQRLMAVQIPDLPYANLSATNIPCRDIGGDFFDVVQTADGLGVVVTDVSGKGISAAILASILQGMIYSQLVAGVPLEQIATSANQFLCQKIMGEKYATVVMLRLKPHGEVEYINCGHVRPLLVSGSAVKRIEEGHLPVGLLNMAEYSSLRFQMNSGDRMLFVTDGVTEAENEAGDFYGEERLFQAAASARADEILAAVRTYCGNRALSDDLTMLELTYGG